MRLLNAETRRLETFFGDEIPKYAILSHTWGDDEVLYEDICDPLKPLPLSKPGFLKIDFTCKQALLDNYRYAWVDTCCIDKQSSAELSEAINSMFLWYLNAEICYAYLADVTFNPSDGSARGRFEDSRWFTRGWTLQELIAPRNVQFFDSQWSFLGYRQPQALHSDRKFLLETRDCLSKNIHERTGVPTNVLLWNAPSEDVMEQWLFPKSNKERLDKVLHRCSVAQKMSWASRRSTKRIEDEAYSLLGIFGVHMPLLYGEGRRAFFRLQLEIMGVCDDQSIFAFLQDGQGRGLPEPLLAVSPAPFANSSDMVHIPPTANIWGKRPVPLLGLSPSSKTVEMEMHICPLKSSLPGNGIPELPEMRYYLAILSSAPRLDLDNPTGLVLGTYNVESGQFYRVESRSLPVISPLSVKGALMIGYYDHCTMFYDLEEVRLATVRLLLLPDHLGDMDTRVYVRRLGPVLRIRLSNQRLATRHDAYPLPLEKNAWTGQLQAPSKVFLDHLRYLKDTIIISGVAILHLEGIGAIILLWGLTRLKSGEVSPPSGWCTILDWPKFVDVLVKHEHILLLSLGMDVPLNPEDAPPSQSVARSIYEICDEKLHTKPTAFGHYPALDFLHAIGSFTDKETQVQRGNRNIQCKVRDSMILGRIVVEIDMDIPGRLSLPK